VDRCADEEGSTASDPERCKCLKVLVRGSNLVQTRNKCGLFLVQAAEGMRWKLYEGQEARVHWQVGGGGRVIQSKRGE